MSLLLYSKIPGTQVKRDANLSNATVQCDPTLLFPQGATQGGVPLNKENLAGKIAVEHDICNLDVNNLTVNGTLKVKGPAEVCDIVCPDTFSVVAVNQITMQALGNGSMAGLMATGRFTSGMKHSGLMILMAMLCFNIIVFTPDLIGITTLPALKPAAGTFTP